MSAPKPYLKGDCLIIANASKPAPEFAAFVRSLAQPRPYGGNTDPEYRRAVDKINEVFAAKKLTDAVARDLNFTLDMERKDRAA